MTYVQMTTMMDVLEEVLSYRRHRWLRLDGSTPIAERRDLVDAWQGSDAYFVFLLSTRAGGLGINLTAADTVIFYESDWNPTMDLQVGWCGVCNGCSNMGV
jgi:DNA helicase INO80